MAHSNPVDIATNKAKEIIIKAVEKAQQNGSIPEGDLPDFVVEQPADVSHGDFAVNIAMVGAKVYRMAPPKIAESIVENIQLENSYFTKVEIAGPGFINLFLSHEWFEDVVESIGLLGDSWGETDHGKKEKVMVEFVSANPTGPMHLGNARGGVLGDSLAAAFNAAGYEGYREFYLNDAGNQIERFGTSLEARYLQIYKGEENIEFPEDGYHGEDIGKRAQEYADRYGDSLLEKTTEERQKSLVDFALPLNVQGMKDTLEKYGIKYDNWFRESTLYKDGTVDKVLKILGEKELTYEQDGAVWYKATEFGGEKDEVLVRQNGNATYFAADIAYHYNKFHERGFSKVINIWGADHHGHVARTKGAMDALGLDGARLDIVLMQLVRLIKDGEPYRMSKRSGQSVTLNDLLDLVPVDVARFFFNMREAGTAMDFDLDLAVEESSKNPVYYVQYVHARTCSLIRKLESEGVKVREIGKTELALLTQPEEIELIRTLSALPQIIIGVTKLYNTAALTHYAVDVSSAYHKFYDKCKILLKDSGDEPLMQGRIALSNATRITVANLLKLLGINAPESM